MGVLRGLAAIKQFDENRGGGAGRKDYFDWKNNAFKLAGGKAAKVRFAQELDEGSPNYVPENGIGMLVTEHRPQDLFPRRVVCTMDEEGECWACEQRQLLGFEDGKEWRQRTSLYVNVLVDDGGVWVPKLLSQGYGPKSVAPWLVEWAGEVGSITNQQFRISRTGTGQNDTSYAVMPIGAQDATPFDFSQYELFDIDKDVLNHVPSDEMERYFLGGKREEATVGAGSTSEDEAY